MVARDSEKWIAGGSLGGFEKGFHRSKIFLGGDLHVGFRRFDDGNWIAGHFGYLRVVGRIAFGVRVRFLDPIHTEHLRRLGLPQSLARDGLGHLQLGVGSLDRASDWRGEDGGSVLVGRFDHLIQEHLGETRAGCVVDSHQFDVGAQPLERVANAVMSLLAADDDLHTEHCQIASKFFLDHLFVFLSNRQDDLRDPWVFGGYLGTVLPDRLAVDRDKDFFEVRVSEPRTLSGRSQDNSDIFHVCAAVGLADLRGMNP